MYDAVTVRDTLDRVLGGAGADLDYLLGLIEAASDASHGTTLTISANAAGEADRLAGPSTRLVPEPLQHDLLRRYADMDGALLIDPIGVCHAVGVILDGDAHGRGDPARGARYNSAIRYQAAASVPTVVVVISEDGGVDLVPVPRRRVRRQVLADAIARLEESPSAPSPVAFAEAFKALEDLAFYLSQEQCNQVNAITQAEQERRSAYQHVVRIWPTLSPHPDMDDTYFLD
jgi:hypothetical protein